MLHYFSLNCIAFHYCETNEKYISKIITCISFVYTLSVGKGIWHLEEVEEQVAPCCDHSVGPDIVNTLFYIYSLKVNSLWIKSK